MRTEHSPNLLKYHPNRYVRSRPFFRPLFNEFRNSAGEDGLLPASSYARVGRKFVFEYWNPELERFDVESRPQTSTQLISFEQSMFDHVARFTLFGRNIFHFSKMLTGLLRLTDVDEVAWSSISYLYPAFYMWFGQQEDLRFGNGRYKADGAYVSSVPNRGIQILVTTIDPEVNYSSPPSFVVHRDFYYYISFDTTSSDDTVGASLARALGTDAMFQRGFQPPETDEETKQQAERSGITVLSQPSGETAQSKAVEERVADLPIFRNVLRLLINGLCYLSSPSREVNRKYPDLAQNAMDQQAPSRLAKRNVQQLRKEGYTEINFCGELLEQQYSETFTGKELSPHWRRGHWRNQAVGTLRTNHRLMWIRPTLVRKEKQREGEILGHIYSAE